MPALYSDEILVRVQEIDPLLVRQLMVQAGYVACRTKWFDDFFAAAQAADGRHAGEDWQFGPPLNGWSLNTLGSRVKSTERSQSLRRCQQW